MERKVTRIYLDHAATTPMLPAARDAMADAWDRWANPSSPHAEGRAAKRALEEARDRIRAALGWPHRLVFTSGASEAAMLAARRWQGGPAARGATEHDAIARALPGAAVLPVDRNGRIAPVDLAGHALVAMQSVNSETGVIQPAEALADARDRFGAVWLADCSQSAGRLPLPPADLLIVSAHKLGGPPGIGALLVRDPALLAPSGGQESGYRAGTENLPAALAFAAALEARPDRAALPALREQLDAAVRAAGGEVVANDVPRLPEITSYRLPGVAAAAQLIKLDLAGFAVSAGSACSSGSLRPSATLSAMGWPEGAAREVIRVSFAHSTTAAEVDAFAAAWTRLAARRRAA
jgi:cysteine desulfurase